MVGGATYEEAKNLATTYNRPQEESGVGHIRVLLGGTSIQNSKSFLSDLQKATAMNENGDTVLNFEIEN